MISRNSQNINKILLELKHIRDDCLQNSKNKKIIDTLLLEFKNIDLLDISIKSKINKIEEFSRKFVFNRYGDKLELYKDLSLISPYRKIFLKSHNNVKCKFNFKNN